MPRTLLLRTLPLLLAASGLAAQRAITTVYGTTPDGRLGTAVVAVGDVNGDGVGDFAISEPTVGGAGRVLLVSGANSTVLTTFAVVPPQSHRGLGTLGANPVGDVNGDGRVDFAIGYSNVWGSVEVFSGSDGALLYRLGSGIRFSGSACDAGDVDQDGTSDFAIGVLINDNPQLWIIRGRSGTQLRTLATTTRGAEGGLRNLGDLNGDGLPEIVATDGRFIEVYDVAQSRLLRTFERPQTQGSTSSTREFHVADWDGDGRNELLIASNTSGSGNAVVFVMSAYTGTMLRSYTLPSDDLSSSPGTFCVMPDIDGDGRPDLAVRTSYDPLLPTTTPTIVFVSGATGRRLGAWPSTAQFNFSQGDIASLGDVDQDGFGDIVIGSSTAASSRGGWQVISGRILAGMVTRPVNCHGGPFAPELGAGRPILGRTWQIVGRDAPSGTACIVVLGLPTRSAFNAGVAGCDLWFDVGSWFVLAQPTTTPTWQLGVPLPDVRQLVGLELALQSFHFPTDSPIRADLSNGVVVRLGY
jgi:hypothetical protein